MANYLYQDQLESKRLKTRFLTQADAKDWARFFDDEEAKEFLPKFSFKTNEELATFWIEKQIKRYEDKQFGLQALIDNSTNQIVGQCGLLTQVVEGVTELEVGYHIYKKFWGQGFAPEAAKIFIDYALKNTLSKSVISIIDVKNIKSQRVAEKNHLIKEKDIIWANLNVSIYRISIDKARRE